ncbi:hypothetical protein Tco_0706666 [Tanacetum coccineum]|uniref:Reverse transcriptase Ty1/copia-type domain-containing protein n=1 Tax=Tanacetum coccineum TaxID=301880 RepID=A0ABQ4YA37_9ASTR
MVRSMMSQATLPISLWGYALETTTHILNLVPTKKVLKTTFEMWKGKRPSLGHIKIWGCEEANGKPLRQLLEEAMKSDVRSIWTLQKKTDMDGKVHTYKARIMLSIAAFHDYELWQMDVKTAFLNVKLIEDEVLEAIIPASMRKFTQFDFLESEDESHV